ncbi:serine protease inhibitor 77Ba-like [Pieris rapae]|uniref:serine protease inhibitor 77Ba-like n=1 Tax=Pieris rapae TaxID=64459 RepID=UPI001E279E39|nr:serine protease inhibitor 77Ba-like [Pieris rapae]
MYLLFVFCLILGSRAQNFIDFNKRVNIFGMELMYFTHQEVNNTLISPFGVWSVLTGLTTGVTNESKTRLYDILRLPNNEARIRVGYKNLTQSVLNNTIVQSKNNLYYHINNTISKQFENDLTNNFDILAVKLDFRESYTAALVANRIVFDAGIKTNNYVLNDTDFTDANVILTCVIKFSGVFESPFSNDRTTIRPFYVSPNNIKEVNMMQQTGQFHYSKIDSIRSEVIEMPYTGYNMSLIVILPNRQVSLDNLYDGFRQTSIEDVVRKLEMEEKKIVSVSIPRFKIRSNLILNAPLSQMGLDIFTPYARFSETSNNFYVSKLVHKVDLEFIESGVNNQLQLIPAKIFVADRPFVYVIVEKTTKTCVISGIFTRPTPY